MLQLQLRPGCECCDRDLPPDSPDAMICSIGVTPPRLDGWAYGRASGRIVSAAGPPV